jgi:quercetin dioxygenase-like cupin family protein
MEHYNWDEMEKEVLSPTIARKIISGEKAMVAQVFLAKGAIVPEHFHESEQITYILEGALEFELEGRTVVVGQGAGAAHPVQRSAPGGRAGGYVGSRHL